MRNGLLHDGLEYWARRQPEKPAVVLDAEDELSYLALARWSDGIAAHLQTLGVMPGDHVAIAGSNSMAWVAAAFAVLKAGAVITPFNDRLLGEELFYLTDFSQPRLIIADAPRTELLRSIGISVPILSMEGLESHREGVPRESPPGWQPVRVDSTAVAMIIFTSGSTARPKGAMMTHGNYLAKFFEMRLLDGRLGPATHSLMPFGLHTSPGLPWGILFTTLLGGTLFVTKKYDAARTLQTLIERKITFFIGAPMIYDQVSQLPDFETADLAALTFARVGGASVSTEVLTRWQRKGVIVRQLYGMSEMGGGSIIATEEEALARPAACGRGLAFTRFRIQRADGTECAPNEPGAVLLQGAGMMSGYWRDAAATAAAIIDGWMHTGDIGVVDDEGYFSFVDRSKEMIKCGGFNVSPAEIEAVLMQIEGVAEAAVFAVPDDKFAEVPCACVYLKTAITPQRIFDYCSSRLAGFKLPRYIVPLDCPLPRLANEKVDRRQLKSRYQSPDQRPAKLDSVASGVPN